MVYIFTVAREKKHMKKKKQKGIAHIAPYCLPSKFHSFLAGRGGGLVSTVAL